MFQTGSLASFLNPFDMKVWLLVALAIIMYGFIYGFFIMLAKRLIITDDKPHWVAYIENVKLSGLFSFGAYFFQGE